MTEQIKYVVGFLFDWDQHVLLIRKNRPDWQAGKLNGIGGKVEPLESADVAMAREFEEETGIKFNNWQYYAVLESPRSKIWVYKGLANDETFYSYKSVTDENVSVWNVSRTTPADAVPNLSWLIPAALKNEGEMIKVYYK